VHSVREPPLIASDAPPSAQQLSPAMQLCGPEQRMTRPPWQPSSGVHTGTVSPFVTQHGPRFDDRDEQPRHLRVARHVRRRPARPECRRPVPERRLRLHHRRRVLPAKAQAGSRPGQSAAASPGEQDAPSPAFASTLTSASITPAGQAAPACRGPSRRQGALGIRSTPPPIRGSLRTGRSTRPSGCMTLQIGWQHGGANWQDVQK